MKYSYIFKISIYLKIYNKNTISVKKEKNNDKETTRTCLLEAHKILPYSSQK
jgi:hypothetical protein